MMLYSCTLMATVGVKGLTPDRDAVLRTPFDPVFRTWQFNLLASCFHTGQTLDFRL